MEATKLTYTRRSGPMAKVGYLRLGRDVYVLEFGMAIVFGDTNDAIRAVIDEEGINPKESRFLLVQTRMAYPRLFSPGKFQVVETDLTFQQDFDGKEQAFVGRFTPTICPEEVREAFREEIGEAAQESHP